MYSRNVWDYQGPQNNLLFVNNKLSAELYNMPANSKIILMDNELDRFYLKETDAAGFGVVRTFDFTEVIDEPVNNNDTYITREEFELWKEQYEQLKEQQPRKTNTGTATTNKL